MENQANEQYYDPKNDEKFDAAALYETLDEQRCCRGMTWQQVTQEIGISSSTVVIIKTGRSPDLDEILAIVRWLGRHIESFTHGRSKVHL